MHEPAVTSAELTRRILERSVRVGIIGQGDMGLPLATEIRDLVPSDIESLRNDVAKSLSNLFESNGIHPQIGFAVVMTAVRVVPDDVVGPAVSDRRRVSPRWGGVASPAPGRDRRSGAGRASGGRRATQRAPRGRKLGPVSPRQLLRALVGSGQVRGSVLGGESDRLTAAPFDAPGLDGTDVGVEARP
jgi:hypothetical protein